MEVQDVEMSFEAAFEHIDELRLAYDGITESGDAHDFSVDTNDSIPTDDRNLIVIDSRIEDYDQLIADLQSSQVNYDILELDGTTDGVDQITRQLDGSTRYGALHIISHGEQANLQLGSIGGDASNIDQYQSQIFQLTNGTHCAKLSSPLARPRVLTRLSWEPVGRTH